MLTNIDWPISALCKGNYNGKRGSCGCLVIIIHWIIPSGSYAVDNEQFQRSSFLSERLFSIYQEGDLFSTELLMSYLVCHKRHLPGPYRLLIAVCLLYEWRTMETQTGLFMNNAVSGVWIIALSAHCQIRSFGHEITCLSFYILWLLRMEFLVQCQ